MALLAAVALALVVIGVWRYERPISAPVFKADALPNVIPGDPPNLPWPVKGAAAVAIDNEGLVAAHADQQPRPLASITKIMTALVILADHPLKPDEDGPTLTISEADVAAYRAALADDESAVEVRAGETLNEWQLLQGLLIPSANNFANILAQWDAGSVETFVAKMNDRAKQIGLSSTHYADASGNNPASVGTATDQVRLAQVAMKDAVFAAIVAEPAVRLPVVGAVHNVDTMLGNDGFIGVKTGSSPEAGAGFVFAMDTKTADQSVRVIGAVLGQSGLSESFDAARSLASAASQAVRGVQAIGAGRRVGVITTAWGDHVTVETAAAASLLAWPGDQLRASARVQAPAPGSPSGTIVGSLGLDVRGHQLQVPLRTMGAVTRPGWRWRLLH